MKAFLPSLFFSLISIMVTTEPGIVLDQKVQSFRDVLQSQEALDFGNSVVLRQVRLRLTLEAGVEIPGISEASINPEVELYFKRVR